MITLDEFIKKWTGKIIDWDGSFGGQCVDLYRQYLNDVFGLPQSPPVVGAADIWNSYLTDKFDRIENTPTGVPQKGDIVIWNKKQGNGFGHVAVFVDGNANTFNSFDQNIPTGSPPKIVNHKYTNILGWLRLKPMVDPLSECLRQHSDLMRQLEEKEKVVVKLTADAEKTKALLIESGKTIGDLNGKLTTTEKEMAIWQSKHDTANDDLRKTSELLDQANKDKNMWRRKAEGCINDLIGSQPKWKQGVLKYLLGIK